MSVSLFTYITYIRPVLLRNYLAPSCLVENQNLKPFAREATLNFHI